jgi:hypothetical protein
LPATTVADSKFSKTIKKYCERLQKPKQAVKNDARELLAWKKEIDV